MQTPTKQQVIREVKEILVIFLFLSVFFCTFTTYRLLVMSELGLGYYHYGFALLKALVLAKVIVLGQQLRLGRIYDDRPLIIPTLYKVLFFSVFVLVFDIFEHLIGSLLHGKDAMSAFQEILSVGRDELLSRTLVTLFAFLPFFAFSETGRRLGEGSLSRMFFRDQGGAGQS